MDTGSLFGRRDAAVFLDADRRADLLSDARLQHRIAELRRALEARLGTRPLRGRWRFGRDEWGQLHGTAFGEAEIHGSGDE